MPTAAPRVRQRMQRNGGALWRDARAAFREIDPVQLAPRVAACVFLAAGVLVLAIEALLPVLHGPHSLTEIAVVAVIGGAAGLVAPWQRFEPHAQLLLAAFAFGLFAWGGVIERGSLSPYLAMLPLPFVYIGFTQRPGTATAVMPVAAFAMVVGGRFAFDQILVLTLVFALPMSAIVGETLAFAQSRRTRAEARVERLLEAVRILARVNDARTGAQLVAALAAELLGAEAVSVLLADRAGSRRYLNRAFFGHPALADAAPLLIDGLERDRTLRTKSTSFIADAARVRALANSANCVRALAVVPLPANGAEPVGVVIAMWTSARRQLPASARQAAELLSEEAGRMFERLRAVAELAHDAETDPLTDLANRRTFARALSTLQSGDALIIVDLDHFKRVNDRYGHQAGDETLRELAACLRRTARQVDCVARYGGEEFAVVLPEAGERGARAMLERVRHEWHETKPTTTFSAGVAVHDGARSPRDTLRLADTALYAAKAGGRNRDVVAPTSDFDLVLP